MNQAHVCDRCGKGVDYAHYIRHKKGVAGGRWKRKAQKVKRIQKPNLHAAKAMVNAKGNFILKDSKASGDIISARLCTKCLRLVKRPHQLSKPKTAEKKD